MLAFLKKKTGVNVVKLTKTHKKRFEEIREQERFLAIDTKKPLRLQNPLKPSHTQKKRKWAVESEPKTFVPGIYYNRIPP